MTPDDAAEASRRVSAFERSGDPGDLWPGLGEPARVAAARELERIARGLLAGGAPLEIDDRFGAYALGVAGHTTGMGPVVGRWIEDGRVRARPDVAAVFARHLDHGRRRAARIECEALPAIDALIARKIPLIALKGFHTSRVFFDEPGMRRISDVDVLVPASRIADAEAGLASVGFEPTGPTERPYKRNWMGSGVDPRFYSVELADARTSWALELHASLDRPFNASASARLDAFRHRVQPLVVAGRALHALESTLLFVYLACHTSQELENMRLLRVFELVQVIRRARPDWNGVRSLIDRSNAAAFVYPALSLVHDLAPGSIPAELLAASRRASTWAARHAVPRLAPAGGSVDERGILSQLMWTRGPAAIMQRAFRALWPASITRPDQVVPGWRARLRRLKAGLVTLRAPDERAD
ncbi:MAG: nucleotidyltransferase family protein [Gemmatimonadaceae bacterium]